jgi:hypothetical protein
MRINLADSMPRKLATLSLVIRGTPVEVDVYSIDHLRQLPVVGGMVFCKTCDYELRNAPIQTLSVAVQLPLNLPTAQESLLPDWLPRAGLMTLIQHLSVPYPTSVPGMIFLGGDVRSDPQKCDMIAFRRRCRHDVLRLAHEIITSNTVSEPFISVAAVCESTRMSRIYEVSNDILPAIEYWKEAGLFRESGIEGAWQINVAKDEAIAEKVRAYDWEEHPLLLKDTGRVGDEPGADVFICHASEDKGAFVDGLASSLRDAGIGVWYDDFSLRWGESLRDSIDRGLTKCRYGIVVFSKAFFGKNWAKYELDGLVGRSMTEGRTVILPIWHGITAEEMRQFSPSLAGRLAIRSSDPMADIIRQVKELGSAAT